MGSFDESFALSDEAVLAEMSDTARINGIEMDCVMNPEVRDNVQAQGGPQPGLSFRMLVRLVDFENAGAKTGSLVTYGTGYQRQARVGPYRTEGGTVNVTCISTSGRAADF